MAVIGELDLIDRIGDKAKVRGVQRFLKGLKRSHPSRISIKKPLSDLLNQLRGLEDDGLVSRAQLFDLMRLHEENGRQRILYFRPRRSEVAEELRNPQHVGDQLFGQGWEAAEGFPKLVELDNGYEIVDFRAGLPGKPRDWLLKIYGFQEIKRRLDRVSSDQMVVEGRDLAQNDFAILYRNVRSNSVCVARWNDSADLGLLEIRVEKQGRESKMRFDVEAVWTRLGAILSREDFEPWALETAQTNMLKECGTYSGTFHIGLTVLKDHGECDVAYTPYTDREPINASPSRIESIRRTLEEGGRCFGLETTWLPEQSDGTLERPLQTFAGRLHTNALVIRARSTAEAVDYVTDRLRFFASRPSGA